MIASGGDEVSPRPGGETDKFGNRYEGAWTVQHVLRVLMGTAESITVEDIDELAEGAEFTFRHGEVVEVHQLKRQNRNANSWTPKSLNEKGIWANVRLHVEAGRQFHFVSTVPARPLQELTDRVRRSSDVTSFIRDWLTVELKESFDELASAAIFGTQEIAWKVLRGFWVEWPDERNVNDVNAAFAGLLLEGAVGRLAAVGLGDLVEQNLGVLLDAKAIEAKLSEYGLRRVRHPGTPELFEQVASITAGWIAGIERELLQPAIARTEAQEIVDRLAGDSKLLLLSGDAGEGKSAVLRQAVRSLDADSVTILGFRLDRLGPFSSTTELGNKLGLSVSPVAALAAVASERFAVLVIDQVDAVSRASGRMPQSFDVIADVIREATGFPKMRVLLACRKFDVENDHRIRELVKDEHSVRVEVSRLTDDQVAGAVRGMGLNPAMLSAQQVRLLRSPLHLVLLASVADEADALSFRTIDNLFDAFWDRKLIDCVRRREGTRFTEVIDAVANAMSVRQRLSVNVSVLDRDNLSVDAAVLVSEHVLTRDGRQFAFFHEAFFGYVFARAWMRQAQSIVAFLLGGEQELFRRAQVRQILNYLRGPDPERFVAEVEGLLTNSRVRFHIKDVVLAIVRALSDPTSAEWEMVSRMLELRPPFEDRVWQCLRTLPWFGRLDAEGVLEEWLAGDDERYHNYALNVMVGAAKHRPDRIAELLQPYAGRAEKYGDWLSWIVRLANVHESRPLFNLLLDAIRSGEVSSYGHYVWMFTHDLAEHQPTWAVELLTVHLVLRPEARTRDDAGKVVTLLDRDHALIRMVGQAAVGAPQEFCELLIPYMLTVMRLTEREVENHLLYDAHFCHRTLHNTFHQLEDALLFGAADALRSFAGQDPEGALPLLTTLAADQHDAAQWLLYEGLRGQAAEHFAAWAGSLLAEGRTRFLSGYISNGVWTTRQLIQAISPYLPPEVFSRVEETILGLRFPWETRQPGWYAFNLLSALDENRLSPVGVRRLGELRRLKRMEQPEEPEPIEMHSVESPIPPEAAQHMTDDDWLRAMARHASDREDFRTFRGGAHELSQVLKAETAKDPGRFARLALHLGSDVNPAYTEALLMGLGEGGGEVLTNPTPVFAAMRHIASLRLASNDRWLGRPLRHYLKADIPDDVISILTDRVLRADDPSEDRTWSTDEMGNRESIGDAIYAAGINTARGSAAVSLGEVLVFDPDGRRTALVVPILAQMAQDPSVAVRSCVAYVVVACLRHARTAAVEALGFLLQGDDRLLATQSVGQLLIYVGNGEPAVILPIVERMLASEVEDVREAGGRLAAFASMEWGHEQLLSSATTSTDVATRKGAATMCAHRLPRATNAAVGERALMQFVNDDDEKVRAAAAKLAGALRGERLRPFREILTTLISSAAYSHALPQLLITLEHAPDHVGDLVIACARRFVDVHGADISDMATSAAGNAREVGQLVFRGYAQATSASGRSRALDLIDQLLALNAYGMADLVDSAER